MLYNKPSGECKTTLISFSAPSIFLYSMIFNVFIGYKACYYSHVGNVRIFCSTYIWFDSLIFVQTVEKTFHKYEFTLCVLNIVFSKWILKNNYISYNRNILQWNIRIFQGILLAYLVYTKYNKILFFSLWNILRITNYELLIVKVRVLYKRT